MDDDGVSLDKRPVGLGKAIDSNKVKGLETSIT